MHPEVLPELHLGDQILLQLLRATGYSPFPGDGTCRRGEEIHFQAVGNLRELHWVRSKSLFLLNHPLTRGAPSCQKHRSSFETRS